MCDSPRDPEALDEHVRESTPESAAKAVREVLQDVGARLQGRLRDCDGLTYADVSEVCREVAKEHGTDVYV